MPAFNHAPFVREALDSLRNSGLPQVEIVVGDDASTDETAALIRRWGQENGAAFADFRFVERKRNVGLAASLNELIALAKGEIIHTLASDDFFLPGGLRAKTELIFQRQEWEYVFCDGIAVGPKGETFAPSLMRAGKINPALLTPELAPEELLYHWEPPANMHSWRRRTFKSHGGEYEFDPSVYCEDLDAAWWALSRRKLGFAPLVCQAYRYRSWPQTSDTTATRAYRDVSYVYAKYARHFEPRVREAMEILSGAYLSSIIGDHEKATRLWAAHAKNAEAYEERRRALIAEV